ncbi:MAG: cytochrome c [Deltaproteobacteria bacterium]|nr:cytochrome c [Deltaproteobacteria bacterium]
MSNPTQIQKELSRLVLVVLFAIASVVIPAPGELQGVEMDSEQDDGMGGVINEPIMIAFGEKIYIENCLGCHGPKAVGQMPDKPDGGIFNEVVVLAPALNGERHSFKHPMEMLFDVIKYGSMYPGTPMISWDGKLSDTEIHSVIAYLYSLWPDKIKQNYLKSIANPGKAMKTNRP